LIYPIYKISEVLPQVKIDGEVYSNSWPVEIYAVVKTQSVLSPNKFQLNFPQTGNSGDYKILYVAPGVIFDVTPAFDRDGLTVHLGKKEITAAAKLDGRVDPRPSEFKK
jgi:hypothetical protein